MQVDTRYIVAHYIELWPILDAIAIYGHIVVSVISVTIAIQYQVSLFMLINIALMCYFYARSTDNLYAEARANIKGAGI